MSGPPALSGWEVGPSQVHEVEIVTGWRFRYCLQGEDDPGLIVSTGDIWFSED